VQEIDLKAGATVEFGILLSESDQQLKFM